MKNILYKLIKKNKGFYNFLINKLTEDAEPELVYRIIGNRKIITSKEVCELKGDIKDCILINVTIKDSSIKSIINNKMERTIITNNFFEQ